MAAKTQCSDKQLDEIWEIIEDFQDKKYTAREIAEFGGITKTAVDAFIQTSLAGIQTYRGIIRAYKHFNGVVPAKADVDDFVPTVMVCSNSLIREINKFYKDNNITAINKKYYMHRILKYGFKKLLKEEM